MIDLDRRIELITETQLLDFIQAQRWFGAKSRELVGARVVDRVLLDDQRPLLVDLLVELRYTTGSHDLYQLMLSLEEGTRRRESTVVATGGWTCDEAIGEPAFARALIDLIGSGASVEGRDGTVVFSAQDEASTVEVPVLDVRAVGVEQSNSSVVIDEALIVKAFRRLEAGVNPELELVRFLISNGFANVPELVGWWSYSGSPISATLGIVERFVNGAVDGWSLALAELPVDPDPFIARLGRLGEVLGVMHTILASDSDDPSFAPEEASSESLALLIATVDDDVDQTFLHLPGDEALAPLAGRADAVRELLRGLPTIGSIGRLIRHHGDFHLGQVLWAEGDWLIIDFEGEPASTLPERRRKRSPLRDVAGMLRSFAYAAAVAGNNEDEFESRARDEFLVAYMATVEGAGILPSPQATDRLIHLFELEKALYELRYELAHRPDWVHVPVSGIVRLLEQASL